MRERGSTGELDRARFERLARTIGEELRTQTYSQAPLTDVDVDEWRRAARPRAKARDARAYRGPLRLRPRPGHRPAAARVGAGAGSAEHGRPMALTLGGTRKEGRLVRARRLDT